MKQSHAPPEVERTLQEAVKVIRRHIAKDSFSVLLYGSWVTGTASTGSDIDLAISGPAEIDGLTMARIRAEMDDLPTLRKVDVVDFLSVGQDLRESIRKNHIVIG